MISFSNVRLLFKIMATENGIWKLIRSHSRNVFQKRKYTSADNYDNPKEIKVEKLKFRSLLRVEGSDALDFLQSLTTNNVRLLEEGEKCIFTALLNAKGRVIHDALIYKSEEKNEYFVECDVCSLQALQVHMKMYRGRKQVDVKSSEDTNSVWVIYSSNEEEDMSDIHFGEGMIVCPDPRIPNLGLRVIAPVHVDVAKVISKQGLLINQSCDSLYRSRRYKLGVGEGALEIPYGRYTPTEINCDYLNVFCLKKGNFIGLEAAMNFKNSAKNENRLMPIYLDLRKNDTFPLNTPIIDIKRKRKAPVGYLKGNEGELGLGLMKVTEALQESSVRIGKILAHCIRPLWWPQGNHAVDK